METQAGGLLQDQNLNYKGSSVGGPTNAKNKGGPSGRKALIDVTNSAKPTLHLLKKHNLKNSSSIVAEKSVSKAKEKVLNSARKALLDVSNVANFSPPQSLKKNNAKNLNADGKEIGGSKVQEKKLNNANLGKFSPPLELKYHMPKNLCSPEKEIGSSGMNEKAGGISGRKALTDLTNSGNPFQQKENVSKKLKAVVGEKILPDAFIGEHFLHNHHECIKAQLKGMDMDYFMKTFGLDSKNNNDHPAQPPPSSNVPKVPKTLKTESPLRLELEEEMAELPVGGGSRPHDKTELAVEHISPLPFKTPKSRNHPYMHWKDPKTPNFMLMDTPGMPKN